MRILIALTACFALTACGGYRKAGRDIGRGAVPAPIAVTPTGAPKVMRLATGPISKACLASDRKARSRERCGCIQAVANDTLSSTDQRLAASFYNDPHQAQVVRQSDRVSNEEFWQTYKSYAETAAAVCS